MQQTSEKHKKSPNTSTHNLRAHSEAPEPAHVTSTRTSMTYLFPQECLMGRRPRGRNTSRYPQRCLRRSQTTRCRCAPRCPSRRGQAGNSAQEGLHAPTDFYTGGQTTPLLQTPPIGHRGEGHDGSHL